jgi:hypothetical protein
LAGSCECGDEPSGSGVTELVSKLVNMQQHTVNTPPVTIQFGIFCLLICCQETLRLNCMKQFFFLPVILCEYETLSFTQRETHRLRIFEKKMMTVFHPKGNM